MNWIATTLRTLLIASVLAGTSMNAFGFMGFGGSKSWKEEVLLHDGRKIVVERTVERGGRHEIGQKPPYKEQRLRFGSPATGQIVEWQDHFSQDLGQANFLPFALGIVKSTPFLVVVPMGCLAYNKWGRPNPSYVIFKYDGKEWMRISLQDLPKEIQTPNLIFSMPDIEVERLGVNFVSGEQIKKLLADYRQPEYQTILREPVKPGTVEGANVNCSELVPYGNGGWMGLDWFSDQPTYEACLKLCEGKRVSQNNCPCARLFKGK